MYYFYLDHQHAHYFVSVLCWKVAYFSNLQTKYACAQT